MDQNNPFTQLKNHIKANNLSHKKYLGLIPFLFFFIIITSGCVTLADPEASQEYNADKVGILDAQTSLGQSFVSRRPNLNGIKIWVSSLSGQANAANNSLSKTIKVRLFHTAGDETPIFVTTATAPISGNNIPISINIPGLKDPAGQSYYLVLSVDSGSLQINGRLEDAYPYGQAYIDSNPINADIAFRLSYNYDLPSFFQDLKLYISNIWIIFPLLVLLGLPGWLLLEASGFRTHFDPGEQTAISIGLSLAVVPLVMLWTTTLDLKWSKQAVFFVSGILIATFIVHLIYVFIITPRNNHKNSGEEPNSRPTWNQIISKDIHKNAFVLVLIFLATLIVRLIMVRDLATPAWVDSVHHALITRLILENGAYPSTYLPYLDITPTIYHPGFHSIAATFVWLTSLDLSRSLLILGQVLNALSIFSVYLLTKTLTHSSSAGVFAAFITGFLTPMPAYYTSWGRYTELTGLLLLPVVLTLLQFWLKGKADKKSGWILGLGAITAAGLFMIHYRVVAFLACLILAYVIYNLVFDRNHRPFKPIKVLLFIAAMAFISIIFVLPWFIPTLKSTVLPRLRSTVVVAAAPFQDFSWPYLTSALGKQALALAGLGLIWSLIKKCRIAFVTVLWVMLMFVLANLDVFKLPGSGLITNISVEIILFIPISVLGGYFIAAVMDNWREIIPSQYNILVYTLLFTLFGFTAYNGSKQLVGILNPITILSRRADLPAIQWVSEHLPENETILINPFAWGYGLYAGNDGGYWLEPLSGRLTLPPPVLYGLGNGSREISQRSEQIISSSTDPAAMRDFMLTQNLDYIFTGARGGVIPPEKLASSGYFDLLYHQDGVWILGVKP